MKKAIAFVLGGAALAIISDVEPIDSVADVNLVVDHFQHIMIIFGGFSVGYGLAVLNRVSWS